MEGSRSQSQQRNLPPVTTSAAPDPGSTPIAETVLTDDVDIIVHSLTDDGFIQKDSKITSFTQLRDFLSIHTAEDASLSQHILSIEDISQEVVQDLRNHLEIEQDAFEHHTRGRLNNDGTRQVDSILHADKLVSTLLGRAEAKKDNYSLTWWKLSTHSLARYSFEREALTESDADATKIVVPHFNVHISDTRRKVGSTKNQMTQVKSGVNELLRQWKKTKDETTSVEQTEERICKLHCNTYRAHQVISEVKNDIWGTASEERLTYVKARKHNSTFHIFLFDKDRTLQENTQVIETDYSGSKSFGVLDTMLKKPIRGPTTRLLKEETGRLIPTLLTRSEEKLQNRILAVDPNVDPNNIPPGPVFDDSTRHRFFECISRRGLLASLSQHDSDDLPIQRVQPAMIRMVAQDWNLVLSQMGETLDDIDRKMSDNNELRNNVLAWRRLLGSWRMTIIEYRAKLLEASEILKPMRASINPSEDAIQSEIEDNLRSYKILTNGLNEIETRMDRSFQALMSSMSILESQKAIGQGSAVARLTELAFIFIPLNFACTFFSMQITDFQGDSQPSIGSFFALALPLMIFLYSIRAFIRSSLLSNTKQSLDTKIRQTSKIPGTSEIPTRVILSFAWQQLGPFSRALLVVVPIAIVVLVLILQLGQVTAFRISGSIVTVLGTLLIVIFLAIESYVPALQASAVVSWIIAMLSIGLGRKERLNSALIASLCTLVTTFLFAALALIPQKTWKRPKTKAAEILAPLWLIEVPIVIIFHYYHKATPRWELWILLIAIFSVLFLFSFVSWVFESTMFGSFPGIIGITAFSLGFPMTMVWVYAPVHGDHLPLYGAVIITFASLMVFLFLMERYKSEFGIGFSGRSWEPFFWVILCVMVAMPVTLVWDTLPSNGIFLPRYAQISVTCGSTVLFALLMRFVRPFSPSLDVKAGLLFWAATAAWLPALLWAGKIEAFQGLTDSRTNTIHVTWTSVLFWTVVWFFLDRIGGGKSKALATPLQSV